MKKFIISTDGSQTYYVVKTTASLTGFAWRRGEPGRVHAHRFNTRKEAEYRLNHGFWGAGGGMAAVHEVDE